MAVALDAIAPVGAPDGQMSGAKGMAATAALAAALCCAWLIRHLTCDHTTYTNPKSWQVTILCMHASTILALRTAWSGAVSELLSLPQPVGDVLLCCAWMATATALRWERTGSLYSASITAIEGLTTLMPLGERVISTMVALNIFIPPVFWLTMAVVCAGLAPPELSFAQMDQHLRKGRAHMQATPEAKALLLANVLIHGVHQACTVVALGGRSDVSELRVVLLGCSVYWAMVCIVDRLLECGRPYPVPAKVGLSAGAACWLLELAIWSGSVL